MEGAWKPLSRRWTCVFHIFSERAKRGTPSPSSAMEMQSHPWSFSLLRQHHSNEFRSNLLCFWMNGTIFFVNLLLTGKCIIHSSSSLVAGLSDCGFLGQPVQHQVMHQHSPHCSSSRVTEQQKGRAGNPEHVLHACHKPNVAWGAEHPTIQK